jgi:hypothetical protein
MANIKSQVGVVKFHIPLAMYIIFCLCCFAIIVVCSCSTKDKLGH